METLEELLSIGAFARRVGLAPSALRFYDDCGVLRPIQVDQATGYRYYHPDQERRARLIRRLRLSGLPLIDVTAVLDGAPEGAREILLRHQRCLRETAATAQAEVAGILRDLPGAADRIEGDQRTDETTWSGGTMEAGTETGSRATVGGAELFSAVRQVAPTVAEGAARAEFPALGRVLIELDGREVRLVATDRYRLALRVLSPSRICGPAAQVLVDVDELKDVADWAIRLPEIEIEVDEEQARISGGGQSRRLSGTAEPFPSYRMILDGRPAAELRVIIDREAFRRALAPGEGDGPILLDTDEAAVHLSSPGRPAIDLRAICVGTPTRIAFDPAVLLPALEAGVGPDILLEISSGSGPALVRSADQGSFTSVVMPVAVPVPG